MQIEEILKQMNLSDREIKVYLAGLESGPILATKLSKKVGIKRTNLYGILESLEEKGLISKGSKSYSKYFIVESPSKLQEKLERQIDHAKLLQKELKKSLPTLEALTPSPELTPKIKIFEGSEGIASMFNEMLKAPVKEIRLILGGREIEKILGKDLVNSITQKRVQKGIRNRAIKKRGASPKTLEEDKQELRETRYFPPQINLKTTIIIYGNNLAIISSEEEDFGFTIQSKELVNSFKVFFEMLWKASDKPKK